MRLVIRRRAPEPAPLHVLEVVTPRTNVAALTSAENLFAALALVEPFSLELAADAASRRFLIRARGDRMRQHLETQLAAAYPQAELRAVGHDMDPLRLRPSERVAALSLGLRAAAYLPIRVFLDSELDAERSAQADPLLGILGALGDLPPGWRGMSQLVLRPAAEDWSRDFRRYGVQHPLEHERVARPTEGPALGAGFLVLLLVALLFARQTYEWYLAGLWLQLAAAVVSLPVVVWAITKLLSALRPPVYDMELVRDKITRIAYHAELRLVLHAPADASDRSMHAQLRRCAAAYRHFNLAAGNGFRARTLRLRRRNLAEPAPLGARRQLAVLTTRELAGLWHLPHAADDIALLERTTARRWLPLPERVADGCRVGLSVHQGRTVPVALPEDALHRHMLLVAKTRRGKSSLMLRLAQHAMLSTPKRSVLLIDPHHDLADLALGIVPPSRHSDVVFIDVADAEHPVGLNILDAGLGWSADRAVDNALSVFEREWGEQHWGPRMEDVFRFTLRSLIEANAKLCAADPADGRAAQYTLLDVDTMLSNRRFRQDVLELVSDSITQSWWSSYWDHLESRFQSEIMNPVLTKIHRFTGTNAARNIVGQAESSIDPTNWLRDGAIVIVHTGRSVLGENAAGLIGSTLLNLASLAVADQAQLPMEQRKSMIMFVDEFHTIPGADYESILSELCKYGANLVLATQSLERLGPTGASADAAGRGLRAIVFANLDGLFAFNCSAEDAAYLVPELGGALDEQDLVELGEHQCYVRLSTAGRRLPTFSVKLDAPPASDHDLRAQLAAASAARYGRPVQLAMPKALPPVVPVTPESAVPTRNAHRPGRRKARREASVAVEVTHE